MTNHPNTLAAIGTGGLATLLVWIATLLGLNVDAVVAGIIVTIASAAVLFIGRRGIKGLAKLIWRGEPDL